MTKTDRATVLQGSIDQLERVSALLAEEVDRAVLSGEEFPVANRLCKETLLGISVLLPKLRAVRNFSALAVPEREGR